jgi:AraC-like DNA-binding protein
LTSDLSKKFDKPGRPDPSDPPLQLDNSAPMMIDKILLNVNDGSITRLSDVSKYFDMKERTLERYLFNHGTSFRKLREKSLFLRSLNKMDDQQKSIKSIAYDLGYSDLSNFSRAFKRWTGRSPELYRESKLS